MSKSFEHYLITRFNIRIASMLTKQLDVLDVSRDERYLEERFRLFFSYTVPSVINQTNKNFEWVILFSDNTPKKFKGRISELTDQNSFIHIIYVKDDEDSMVLLNNYIMKKKCDWIITSRVDNDDALALTFIDSIQLYVQKHQMEKYALIFNDGYQYEEKTGVMARYHFPKNHFSSLVSQYQPHPDNILNYGHMDIDKKVSLNEVNTVHPNWLEIVHDTNVSNRMHFLLKDIVTGKNEFEQFGIQNKFIAEKRKSIVRGILLKPVNACRLLRQYGIKKTFVKIIGKVNRRYL